MRLALKAVGQCHPANFHVVGLPSQHRFDAGVDMLQVGLLAARKMFRRCELGNELQPGRTRQGSAARFQKNQMVVCIVAAVEVAGVP